MRDRNSTTYTECISCKKILLLCEATLDTINGMIETVKMYVKDAYEEKAAKNRQVT